MTSLTALRRRCEERVAGLDIPHPFDIDVFCAQVAERRGRPIRVCALPGPAGPGTPCGAWLQTAATDWVFVEQSTSRFHREHIVLHELAHMLCGHTGAGRLDDELVAKLVPGAAGAIRHMLGRTSYTTLEEQEAEMTARVLLAHAHRETRATESREPDPAVRATIQRIDEILG